MEAVSEKLDYFVEKFVLKFENRYSYYMELLEKFVLSGESRENSFDSGVAYGLTFIKREEKSTGMAKAFNTIIYHATMGSLLELYMEDSEQKENLLDQLESFKTDRTGVRRHLVEAAYKIFCSFEFQFSRVTIKDSWQKAITKLSEDAVARSIHYLLTNPHLEWSAEDICTGVILGESPKFTSLLHSGRTVYYRNTPWNTAQLFSKVGLTDKTHFYSKRNGKVDTFKYGYRLILEHDDLEEYLEENPKFLYTYVLDPNDENENIQRLLNIVNEKDPILDASTATTSNNVETIIKQVKSDITKTIDDVEEQNKQYILETVEYVNNDLKEKLKFITEHENKLVMIEETLKNEKAHVAKQFVEVYSFIGGELKTLKDNLASYQKSVEERMTNLEKQFQQVHLNMKQEREDNEKRFANLNSLVENSFMKIQKHLEAYEKAKMDKLDNLIENVKTMQGNGNNFT